MQLRTSPLAIGSLLDAFEGREADSPGAALRVAERCFGAAGLGLVAAELEGAELEDASVATVLVCLSNSFAPCLLGCKFLAACWGCFAPWLAAGRGRGNFPAVLLLLDALAACCGRAPVPCNVFAAACCSSLRAELGCLISSTFCKGHYS